MANIDIDGNMRQLELLITTEQTHPLLGLNWIEKLGIPLKTEILHQTVNHKNKPNRTNNRPVAGITTLKSMFHKLFTKNHTLHNFEVYIELKEGPKLIQRKG